ncbi:erythromycin esterase family protein [Lentzea alba]|uniref:erythromycin esterase family protein n=1 Tax=Lentzea alba TaxID=2714351 RepID=UPI0039BF7409
MTSAIRDSVRAVDAAGVLGLLRTRPRLLGLGEPVHGEDVLLGLRNGLFRQLVEQEHFRTIAIESDCLLGLMVDDYVTTGAGTLDEVVERGFSHAWFNVSEGNRELVRWMREYNDGRPAAEQVRFAGFEGPLTDSGAASPRQALIALHGHLAARLGPDLLPCTEETLDGLIGDDDRWSDPGALMDPSKSVGRTPEADRLRQLAGDLAELFDARTAHLAETSTPDEWDRARLYRRAATGVLEYHFWLADTSPDRVERLLGLRESMMAGNLLALAERGPTLANGHNGHLQRVTSSMNMGEQLVEWPSAGMILSDRLGEEYALVTTAVGTLDRHGVDAPPSGTLEGVLHEVPQDRYVVDARVLAAAVGDLSLVHRESSSYRYSPLSPVNVATNDVIAYVKDAAPN